MKFTNLFTIFLALILISSYIIIKNKNLPDNTNTLTIGTAAGYAPFVSINQQGEYEGFDIDVAQALAQKMGKKLILKDLGSMVPLFIALEQGSIDAIIWGLSITQQRLQKIAMVRYQGETTKEYPLLFWDKIPENIKSIDDMKGMIVCVEPASSQEAMLNKYSFITKQFTEKVDDALFNIQYGKVDAALVEPSIAKKFNNKYPEIQQLNVPLDQQDYEEGIGIGIKKNNIPLINQIKQAVEELQREDVIKAYEKKWNIS